MKLKSSRFCLTLTVLFFTSCAHQAAVDQQQQRQPNVVVQDFLKDIDTASESSESALAETGKPVQFHSVHLADTRTSTLLPFEKEKLLKHVGLQTETNGWDFLQKDMLLVRATYKSGAELSAQYPQIAIDKLNLLIEVVKNHSLAGRI